jgi:hypothetical protein
LILDGNDAMSLFSQTAQEVLELATNYINQETNWPNGFPN